MKKILVPIKRVVDANVTPRVRADGAGMDVAGLKMAINPFCEIAVEEAVRLTEAGVAEEVLVVCIGSAAAQDILRHALAMGADRALLLVAEQELEALAVAKLLRRIAEDEDVDLIILGKQSIDNEGNQTGQMLAALLGWGQATFASKLDIGTSSVTVTREIDSGLQIVELPLPAVVTTDLRLNQPRYASLPNIMKARKKPLAERSVADMDIDIAPRLKIVKTEPPHRRAAGVIVQNAMELVEKLKNEAGVL